jgi:tetraprenyl-beta-curcumene synthase
VACHLTLIRPTLLVELRRWRRAALAIGDPRLQQLALGALEKHGNIEGAALLGTLAPAANRSTAVRAQVAFQALYNHLDALSEQPSDDPRANAASLHQTLLHALEPTGGCWRSPAPCGDDAYVGGLVEACREALAVLPSYPRVEARARDAAARILGFQTLNLAHCDGGHHALRTWAIELTPPASRLRWWETAAAAGSSLPVHALIAAAAKPGMREDEALAVASAYFPWVGALHSLLDSLVDRDEDATLGRPSLLGPYGDRAHVVAGLGELALQARNATNDLPRAGVHRVILSAMCSYYLSAPEASGSEGRAVADRLKLALGHPLTLAVAMFGAKRRVHRLSGRPFV